MGNQDENGWRSVHGYVSGRVQGVGFRWFVMQTARRLGLGGDVRNLRDGRVEFRARGRAEAIDHFLEAVRKGPADGRVERLDLENTNAELGDAFTIR